MPFFCYTNSGQTIERLFHCGQAPRTVTVDGKRFHRDIPAEWTGRADIAGNWPKKSDALGVHHSQIGEAAEHLAAQGVPTTFCNDGTGRCNVESPGHQNRIMEALGMHDRDAGYGQRAKP